MKRTVLGAMEFLTPPSDPFNQALERLRQLQVRSSGVNREARSDVMILCTRPLSKGVCRLQITNASVQLTQVDFADAIQRSELDTWTLGKLSDNPELQGLATIRCALAWSFLSNWSITGVVQGAARRVGTATLRST